MSIVKPCFDATKTPCHAPRVLELAGKQNFHSGLAEHDKLRIEDCPCNRNRATSHIYIAVEMSKFHKIHTSESYNNNNTY